VSAEKAGWPPKVVVSRPFGERTGRVVSVDVGVVTVVSRRQKVRASLGSTLLEAMAHDPEAAPQVGDRVQLRSWVDGPVTVERVLVRHVPTDDAR
jgi:ribosome biogenesis GTPase